MTFEQLKERINTDLKELGKKVQQFSKDLWGKNKVGKWDLFGEVKGEPGWEYAFHIGGKKEFQFNIALEDAKKLRYGLAFSFQPGQDIPDPIKALQPFVSYFNKSINAKMYDVYNDSGEVVSNKEIHPKHDGEFWFYGEKIDWRNGDISKDKIERIRYVLNDLYETYKLTMKGGKDIMDSNDEIFILIRLIEGNKQLILTGAPGTGKTYTAKEIVKQILGDTWEAAKFPEQNDNGAYTIVQFHPSYSYEDFVQGIVAKTNVDKVCYEVKDKILLEMAKEAQKPENKDKKYFLILDEINRANLPSVLGELIYALEYRDKKVDLLYGKYSNDAKDKFSEHISLPKNLYIIGTMNTADRSIGHIDYAIRRRFVFFPVQPREELVHIYAKEWFEKVSEFFDKDKKYLSPDFDAEDVCLGHSYFMVSDEDKANGKEGETLAGKFAYQVLPLLREYYKDGILTKEAKLEINGIGSINIAERINYGEIYAKLVEACNRSGEVNPTDNTTQLESAGEE